MSSQLAESKAAASAAQHEVTRLNEIMAACASSSEASVRSMDATAALGSSQLRQLMEQLADAELQARLFTGLARARRQSERRSFLRVFF